MDLLEALLEDGIIKVRDPEEPPYKFKSGVEGRVFIDIKQAFLNPELLRGIVNLIDRMGRYEKWRFDRIASVVLGGVPLATALTLLWNKKQVIIRPVAHDHGLEQKIVGDCKGLRCLLIEDVATSGGTIIDAVQAIRDAGGVCKEVIVVVDREEGAKELCGEYGVILYSCFKKCAFTNMK